MDDVLKIFKGDFAVVFGDIGYEETSYTFDDQVYKSKRPVAKLIFNAAIADKAAYDKVAAKLAEMGEMEMRNGQYVPSKEGGNFGWSMDGKNLIIATDSVLLQQYLAGKGNAAIPSNIADQSKGKAVAFYIDINKILGAFAKDSVGIESIKAAQATFNNAIATSDNYNGKYVAGNMELKMVNEKENSLVSLVKFFAAMSKDAIEMQNRYKNDGMSDMEMEDIPKGEEPEVPPPPTKPE